MLEAKADRLFALRADLLKSLNYLCLNGHFAQITEFSHLPYTFTYIIYVLVRLMQPPNTMEVNEI